MLNRTYSEMNKKIYPSAELMQETIMKATAQKAPRRPINLGKVCTVALAAVLVVALSLTTVAAIMPGFREMLFGAGSPVADSLNPVVDTMTETEGLKLEVLGAMGDSSGFSAYFTLQDTNGAGRLENVTDVLIRAHLNGEYPPLYNSLTNEEKFNAPSNSYVTAEDGYFYQAEDRMTTRIIDYEPETQTLLCRFDMALDSYDAANASVKLVVRRITYLIEKDDYAPINIDAVMTGETVPITAFYGYDDERNALPDLLTYEDLLPRPDGMSDEEYAEMVEQFKEEFNFGEFRDENGKPVMLEPQKAISPDGMDYASITAAGFVNGKLHIQAYSTDGFVGSGTHQGFDIVCADAGQGETVADELSNINGSMNSHHYDLRAYKSLGGSSLTTDGVEAAWGSPNDMEHYTEHVYDISPEEIGNYEFFARGVVAENTQLDMSIDFDLGGTLPQNTAVFTDISTADAQIDELEITPMGVYVSGSREGIGSIESLEILCGDETVPYLLITSSYGYYNSLHYEGDDDTFRAKYITDSAAVDPATVIGIRINGETVIFE